MILKLFKYLLVIFSVLVSFEIIAQDNTLTIQIENVQSSDGEIQIGLYKSQEGYPYDKEICTIYRFKAIKDITTYTIENLESGFYAMAVYHDENNNDECDTNFFGYPLEGYCFSNRKDIIDLLPPSFETAKIKVDGDTFTTMKIIYKTFF